MNHQNINNQNEVNLCDFLRDDPGYGRYELFNKDTKKSAFPYDNHLHFECVHPSPQSQRFDSKI